MPKLIGPSGREYFALAPGPYQRYWMGTRTPESEGVIVFAPSEAQLLEMLERAPAAPVVDGIQTYHTYRVCTPEDWEAEKDYHAATGVEPTTADAELTESQLETLADEIHRID